MIILGFDPGTAILGWGIIDTGDSHRVDQARSLAYGCITTDKSMTPSQRLLAIASGVEKLLDEYKPALVGVERLFFQRNVTTGMAVSEARGVVLYIIERQGFQLAEYTPQEVKMTLTGYGRAEKKQVQEMVKLLLKMEKIPKPDDAADALAIALTAAQMAGKPKLR